MSISPIALRCDDRGTIILHSLLFALFVLKVTVLEVTHLELASEATAIRPCHISFAVHCIVAEPSLIDFARWPRELTFAVLFVLRKCALENTAVRLLHVRVSFKLSMCKCAVNYATSWVGVHTLSTDLSFLEHALIALSSCPRHATLAVHGVLPPFAFVVACA